VAVIKLGNVLSALYENVFGAIRFPYGSNPTAELGNCIHALTNATGMYPYTDMSHAYIPRLNTFPSA
jgi:hypothetical protein